jgi:DNA-binding protein H-NS
MMTRDVPRLRAQLAELNARIEQVRAAEMGDAIERCRAIIDEFDLTAFDLGFVKVQSIPSPTRVTRTFKGRMRVRAPIPPKYRDPATGVTWSGRGRTPRWITDDDDRDSYLIRSA